MNTIVKHGVAAAILVSAALPAVAMPAQTTPMAGGSELTPVSGGCGPGFHRGPMGGCRPNAVVVVRRPVCRLVLLPLPHRVCRY